MGIGAPFAGLVASAAGGVASADGGGAFVPREIEESAFTFVWRGEIEARFEKRLGADFAGGKAAAFAFVLGEKRMLPEFEKNALGMKADEKIGRAHV